MKKLILALAVIGISIACSAQNESQNLEVAEAQKMIAENDELVIIDVRTIHEYRDGYIKNAKHFDFYEEGFESTLEKLPKDKTYLVYCHSGGRSGKTLNKMNDLGFEHVYHLEEGYADWKEKGGAIEK